MAERSTEAEALSNIDGTLEATYSTLANRHTGLGTSRDKSLSFVNTNTYLLSEPERIALFRSSNICKKVVMQYPLDAARGAFDFTSSTDSFNHEELHSYFENLATGPVLEKLTEVSIEARLHGDSYLLLGIEDGESWDKPVRESRIKSLRWIQVLYHNEVTPDFLFGINPVHYLVSSSLSNTYSAPELRGKLKSNTLRVHKSRIIRFSGHRLYGSAQHFNAGYNDSVLQPMFEAFSAYTSGLMASSAMLADYNVFRYKLKGLASMIKRGEQDLILERFLTIQMGMGITKGLVMDADNEDADFISRSYGGVKDIIEMLLDNLVAATDLPRYKLLGESNRSGNLGGNKSEQERFEWAAMVRSWEIDNWLKPLKYIMKLSLLAKDGVSKGILPDSYGIKFNSIFEQSPLEDQEMRLKKAQEHDLNIKNGIYTSFEARSSTYGQRQWNAEIQLDERISKKLEKEIMTEPKESSEESSTLDDTRLIQDSQYNEDRDKSVTDEEFDRIANISDLDIMTTLEKIIEEP